MFILNVTVKGDKPLIDRLLKMEKGIPKGVKRGLSRIARGIYAISMEKLSGSKGSAGSYPVPVITGHLRRLQGFVLPGRSKSAGGLTFTARAYEAIIYNAAEYSRVIREGKGSSAKFGKRDFIIDAMNKFNRGNTITKILNEEVFAGA